MCQLVARQARAPRQTESEGSPWQRYERRSPSLITTPTAAARRPPLQPTWPKQPLRSGAPRPRVQTLVCFERESRSPERANAHAIPCA